MITALTKIKRCVKAGQWRVEEYCLRRIGERDISVTDLKHAILTADDFKVLTDDPSHARYVVFGESADGRPLDIVVFFRGRSVRIKTAYEPN